MCPPAPFSLRLCGSGPSLCLTLQIYPCPPPYIPLDPKGQAGFSEKQMLIYWLICWRFLGSPEGLSPREERNPNWVEGKVGLRGSFSGSSPLCGKLETALQSCPELKQVDQDFVAPCMCQVLNGSPSAKGHSLGKATLLQRHFLKKADSPRRSGGPQCPLQIRFYFSQVMCSFCSGQPFIDRRLYSLHCWRKSVI